MIGGLILTKSGQVEADLQPATRCLGSHRSVQQPSQATSVQPGPMRSWTEFAIQLLLRICQLLRVRILLKVGNLAFVIQGPHMRNLCIVGLPGGLHLAVVA